MKDCRVLPFPPEIQTAWPEPGARSLTTQTTSRWRWPATIMLSGGASVGSGPVALLAARGHEEGDGTRTGLGTRCPSRHGYRLGDAQPSHPLPSTGLGHPGATLDGPGATHGAEAGAERQPAAPPWQPQCEGLSPPPTVAASCVAHHLASRRLGPPPSVTPLLPCNGTARLQQQWYHPFPPLLQWYLPLHPPPR